MTEKLTDLTEMKADHGYDRVAVRLLALVAETLSSNESVDLYVSESGTRVVTLRQWDRATNRLLRVSRCMINRDERDSGSRIYDMSVALRRRLYSPDAVVERPKEEVMPPVSS